jgi:hypothetical protein
MAEISDNRSTAAGLRSGANPAQPLSPRKCVSPHYVGIAASTAALWQDIDEPSPPESSTAEAFFQEQYVSRSWQQASATELYRGLSCAQIVSQSENEGLET